MGKPYIGGQAVIEGVMMRSPKSFVVAVRRSNGSIALREERWVQFFSSWKFMRWPLLRGTIVLLESLHNGFSALSFSADQAEPDDRPEKKPSGSEWGQTAVLVLATVFMLGLFIAAPHLLTYLVGRLVGAELDTRGVVFHVVDGFFRIAILLGYIAAISKTREAKRLFEYHGAEHQAIWAYESGQALTVENARRFPTWHPRCGTSFLFVVVLVAILVHVALVPLVPRLHSIEILNQLLLVGVKVPMAFPIAGVAYELQRLSAREGCPRAVRWLTLPGIWLQSVTTRRPSDEQLEIAVLALGRSLALEEGRAQVSESVRVFADFSGAMAA